MIDSIGTFGRLGDLISDTLVTGPALPTVSSGDAATDAKIDKAIADSGAAHTAGIACGAAGLPPSLCETVASWSMSTFVKLTGVDLSAGHYNVTVPHELEGLGDPHALPGFATASPWVAARTRELHDAFGRAYVKANADPSGIGADPTYWDHLTNDQWAAIFQSWRGEPMTLPWNTEGYGRLSYYCNPFRLGDGSGNLPAACNGKPSRPTVDDLIWSWAYLRATAEDQAAKDTAKAQWAQGAQEAAAATAASQGAQEAAAAAASAASDHDVTVGIQSAGSNALSDATKGHGIATKAIVTVGAAAAIYSAVQFARQKPNVIVDQSKKLIAKVRK